MIILGLDVATHTGVAVLSEGVIVHREVIYFPPEGKHKKAHPSRFVRYDHYAAAVEDLLTQWAITHCYVEGYSFGSRHAMGILMELGTTVRQVLHESEVRWHEVPPGTLKKFVTGSGVAKKDLVLLNVFKRFGVSCDTDDEADAVALAYFGAAHQGANLAMPADQMKVAKELDKR